MTTETKRYTPEDLLCMPDGYLYELIDDQLVERTMSVEADILGIRLITRIARWTDESGAGFAFGAQAGLQIFPWAPNLVRFADGGFIRADRAGMPGAGHFHVAPDLVFEVTSPNDIHARVEEKIADYLRAGVRLVWVLVPETRWAHIYRLDGSTSLITGEGDLDGEDVLPGFRCPLHTIFAALQRPVLDAPTG